jgi:riboflavin synthase
MFTGIVTEIGTVRAVRPSDGGLELTIESSYPDLTPGESVAVDGACLTIASLADRGFTAQVVRTSLERTRFGELGPGTRVNLERALRVGDRLGGHLVQGHVDGVGTVAVREAGGDGWESVRFTAPPPLMRYLVEKGSVAVDGVSLTVIATGPDWFTVGLIPTTLERTTLGRRQVGDPVNLEVDVIAKYVEKLVAVRDGS